MRARELSVPLALGGLPHLHLSVACPPDAGFTNPKKLHSAEARDELGRRRKSWGQERRRGNGMWAQE